MNTYLIDQLEQIRKDYEQKKQELEALKAKKESDLLDKAAEEFGTALREATVLFQSLPESYRKSLFELNGIREDLKEMGLVYNGGKSKGPRKVRVANGDKTTKIIKVSDELAAKILAVLPAKSDHEGKRLNNSEIAKKVGKNPAGFGGVLLTLKAQGKIDFAPDGTNKFWFKL